MKLGFMMVALLAVPPAARAAEDCAALAAQPFDFGLAVQVAKNAPGALHLQFQQYVEQIDRCPQAERPWYLAMRAAELGGGRFPVELAGAQVADLKAALDRAVEKLPKSVRLATIRARMAGTADEAKAAVALDGKWAPAQVALATAHIRNGDHNTAVRTLTALGDLSRMPCAQSVLAQAKLLSGDAEGALAAAALERAVAAPLEPVTPKSARRCLRDATEWSGLAALALGRTDQALRSLVAAGTDGGELARRQLRSVDPPLKKAVRALAKDKRLDARQRAWVRELISEKK